MFKCIVELVKELSKEFDRLSVNKEDSSNSLNSLSHKDLLLGNYLQVSVEDTTNSLVVNINCKEGVHNEN